MRQVLIGDLMAAARVIVPLPAQDRRPVLRRLLAETHAAHLYAKRFGRPHRLWGNGSLMARAMAIQPEPVPPWGRPLRAALAEVIAALQERDRFNHS